MPTRKGSPLRQEDVQPHRCSIGRRLEILRGTPFFGGLRQEDLAAVNGAFHEVSYAANEGIYHAGEAADHLFVVAAGKIKLTRHSLSGQDVLLEILAAGDFFGTLALLGDALHPDTAAREALAAKDGALVLPYVQAGAEAELTAAFEHALAVRALGPEAQKLADHFFFKAAVHLHREGEGAAYTGLKEEAVTDPALLAADAVLEGENLAAVYGVLEEALRTGVAARYTAVQEAREHATHAKSVAADRERVEAELGFEKYVYGIYTAARHVPAGTRQVSLTQAPARKLAGACVCLTIRQRRGFAMAQRLPPSGPPAVSLVFASRNVTSTPAGQPARCVLPDQCSTGTVTPPR